MKKALVLVLCVTLLLTLAVGCTPTTTTTATPPSGTTGTTPESTTTQGPTAEITYVFPLMAGVPVDLKVVNDAINEISIAKVNVKVNLAPISVANYSSQVPLMISGKEAMDLVETLPGGPTLYASMVSQGQLMDITDPGSSICTGYC